MSWRKWLVRGLVFSVVGVLVAGAAVYQHLTNPSAIRAAVVAQLEERFIGGSVRLESAHLHLLGGIALQELRLVRRDDPENGTVLYVPDAVIYHDKEKLLHGSLAIRRIDLHRPRFHIVRGADGRWNVAGILGPVNPDEYLPTIVIRNGVFVIEDRLTCPEMAPIEIQDVNVTMVNDPLPTLDIQFRGRNDVLGPLQIRAAWQRISSAMTVSMDAGSAPFGPPVLQRLAPYCPELVTHLAQLEGAFTFHADLGYDPALRQSWSHQVRWQLRDGKLQHPQLPLPLTDLEAVVQCKDGQLTLDKLTAHSGRTEVEVSAGADRAAADANFDARIKVKNLEVSPQLFERFPESLHDVNRDFSPAGPIDFDVEFGRHDGIWSRHIIAHLEDVSACCDDFRYSLEHIRGTIDHKANPAHGLDTRHIDLVGMAGDRPIHIKGDVSGPAPHPAVAIDIWGDNVPLDKKLLAALPGRKYQDVALSFHPTGRGDFLARLRREQGAAKFRNHITVRFHDAAIRYDVFPYPLDNVSGTLEILPDHWEYRDFHGAHNGCEFQTWGRSSPSPAGDHVVIELRATNLALDQELEAALSPRMKAAWKSVSPGGHMNLAAQVDTPPNQPDDISVTVTAGGCTLNPDFFPYPLNEVSGTVHYAHDKVELEQVLARHGPTVLSLEKAEVLLRPGGGFYARLNNLVGNPLLPDAAFVGALPEQLRKICGTLHLKDPMALLARTVIVDSPPEAHVLPVVYWDAGVSLRDAGLSLGLDLTNVSGQFWCEGKYNGRRMEGLDGNLLLDQAVVFKQPVRGIHTHLLMPRDEPEVLVLPDLKGQLFGGDLNGRVRVEFGPTIHYVVDLTATQVQLEEIGRHNQGGKADWSGEATARLYLSGHGADLQGLEGRGQLDVPSGRMSNLPPLLDLLKVLAVRLPDRTAFEEAHATFEIKGPRVKVEKLDLFGNAISLSGAGEMNLDGSDLNLDFFAVWGRIMQWLPELLKPIPPVLSQQLFIIQMRGKLDDVHCYKMAAPFFTRPLADLVKRMNGGPQTTNAPKPATNGVQ